MTIIGIRKEDKNPWERRVPITPELVGRLKEEYGIATRVQSFPKRAFSDAEFQKAGAEVIEGFPNTKVVFAVKEIPSQYFQPGQTYVYFSHVIKGQDYNMPMLRRLMDLGCSLIDYEKITDEKGRRLVFFGKEAGQAGMIDTLWALGRQLDHEAIPSPFGVIRKTVEYNGLDGALSHLNDVGHEIEKNGLSDEISPLIVGFAGYGNVSRGAQEVLNVLPVLEILPHEVEGLKESGNYSRNHVYKVVFKEEHMAELIEKTHTEVNTGFELQDYYDHPEKYQGTFPRYVPHLTILMNCIYWDERYPRLVTKEQLRTLYSGTPSSKTEQIESHSSEAKQIDSHSSETKQIDSHSSETKQIDSHPTFRVVGDISCDYEGAIEATLHSTDSGRPTFVYDPLQDKIIERGEGSSGTGDEGVTTEPRGLTIMAVDNLPAELPKEASSRFGASLFPFIPSIARADYTVPLVELELVPEVRRALILYQGKLTPEFDYLKEFVEDGPGE